MKKLSLVLVLLLGSISVTYAETFVANLNGLQLSPPTSSDVVRATCRITLFSNSHLQMVCYTLPTVGTTFYLHGPATYGMEGPVLYSFPASPGIGGLTLNPQQVEALRAQLLYIDMHNPSFPERDGRGQIGRSQTISDDDRDGRTDPVVFRRSTGQFWVMRSTGGVRIINEIPNLGNAVYLTNTWGRSKWFVGPNNENGLLWYWFTDNSPFGGLGAVTMTDVSPLDFLVPGDWNGDGEQDRGVFRRSDGQWRFTLSDFPPVFWGIPGDEPCVGDYDGDGRSDICVVREEKGTLVWYMQSSFTGQFQLEEWGVAGVDRVFPSIPVYLDGDAKQELMVYREVGGQRIFEIRRSTDNAWIEIPWGLTTDTPLFGDYDGDGKTDFVARRDVNGSYIWYILRSSDSQVQYFYWGQTGDE